MHLADAEPARVRALIRFALLISTGMSVCFGAALAGFASPLADLFHDPGLTSAFVVVGAALPAFTFRDLALAANQGWRTQRAFALIGWFYEPIVRFGLTACALALGLGLDGALVRCWWAPGRPLWQPGSRSRGASERLPGTGSPRRPRCLAGLLCQLGHHARVHRTDLGGHPAPWRAR